MSIFEKTIYASLGVQVATGIADIYALTLDVPKEQTILKEILWLELIVQMIEGIFYVWLIRAFMSGNTSKNVTEKRYYDWFLTTPTMLISLVAYLYYLKNESKLSLIQFIITNKRVITQILVLNALMLMFGLLSELGILSVNLAVSLGFVPFLIYYYLIYENFARESTEEGKKIYWYFFLVWSIYGVAAYLPYYAKNTLYNVLDLFAKNFFGIFLSYLVIKHHRN